MGKDIAEKRLSRLQKAKSKVTKRKKKIFLMTLADTGQVGFSANAAGYADSTYLNRIRKEDSDFAEQWDEALETAMDILEDEAHRRAVEGTQEPVFHKGVIVGHKNRYSDGLLTTLLKAHKPDKYRDNTKVDHTVSGTFGIAVLPSTQSDALVWEQKAAIVHKNQDKLMDKKEEPIDVEFEEVEDTGMKRS